jgi:hypothetical protein
LAGNVEVSGIAGRNIVVTDGQQGHRVTSKDSNSTMRFIEMSGKALLTILNADEVSPDDLKKAGLTEQCLVRINMQGDIEVRRHDRWDVVGGLLGDFERRIKKASGRDWAA